MRVILGTYRGPAYVHRTLLSLAQNLTGWRSLTVVDDSGRSEWRREYMKLRITTNDGYLVVPDSVISLNKEGYNRAMKRVCASGAHDDRFVFWEEDFELTAPVDLGVMNTMLDDHPELAQIALLRQPWFPIEIQHGGLIEGLAVRLGAKADVRLHLPTGDRLVWDPDSGEHIATDVDMDQVTHISQRGTFTGNPSLWQRGVARDGWPSGKWSEDRKRDQLLGQGYRFGFLPGIKVEHFGERSGHGY